MKILVMKFNIPTYLTATNIIIMFNDALPTMDNLKGHMIDNLKGHMIKIDIHTFSSKCHLRLS